MAALRAILRPRFVFEARGSGFGILGVLGVLGLFWAALDCLSVSKFLGVHAERMGMSGLMR